MRKLLTLLLILALAFSVTGATCMQNIQTKACDPPAAVLAALPAAITVIKIALSTFVPGTAEYLAAVDASAVASSLEVGVCVSVTQLNALIAFLQSDNAKVIETKAMVKAGPMRARAVNVAPFVAWAGTLK
jgi:hypothetical protein